MSILRGKEILVTGGGGFLGTHVVEALENSTYGPKKILVPRTSEGIDLRRVEDCRRVVEGTDYVIHLAANVGGIGKNQRLPGTLFYDNVLMGTHMMEEARVAGIDKFVAVGTVCAYPKYTEVPFREDNLWEGYPEETNAPYGLAKKMLLVQAQAYRMQYGFNAIYLMPVNLYGPKDSFDLEDSHVIPALVRKFHEARVRRLPSVDVWGTGKATREFLYVKDAAEGIVLALERYNGPEPVNLGSAFEISIGELAEMISRISRYSGTINFDSSKPDGQPRRKLDTSKAEEKFGFKSKTPFEEGLAETIAWYEREIASKTFRA